MDFLDSVKKCQPYRHRYMTAGILCCRVGDGLTESDLEDSSDEEEGNKK